MKKNTAAGIALAVMLLLPITAGADLNPVTKIVEQPDSPVKITSYSAKWLRRSQYTDEGIHHSVRFTNSGTKTIDAIQFGLVSFNVWNEFLDRTNGLDTGTMTPGKNGDGTWVARSYADFSFLTGVTYVRRVRFDDGTIWVADDNKIVDELRKIEKDFDASILKQKDGSNDK